MFKNPKRSMVIQNIRSGGLPDLEQRAMMGNSRIDTVTLGARAQVRLHKYSFFFNFIDIFILHLLCPELVKVFVSNWVWPNCFLKASLNETEYLPPSKFKLITRQLEKK